MNLVRPSVALAFALLSLSWTGASRAQTTATIDGNPLTIVTNSLTQLQVFNADIPGSAGQFFLPSASPASAGWFASIDGEVFQGPEVGSGTSFTPLSTSGVSGAGTPADPFTVTTVSGLGDTGLQATVRTRYVNGSNFFSQTFTLSGAMALATEVRIFFGADVFLATSDAGIPFRDPESRAVGGRTYTEAERAAQCSFREPAPALPYFILFTPQDPESAFTATGFSSVWSQIGAGQLDNQVGSVCVDNGAALQWDRTLAAGQSTSVRLIVSFGEPELIGEPALEPGTLQLTQTSYDVSEEVAGGTIDIPVLREGGSVGEARVQVDVVGGTATQGLDYEVLTSELLWPDGEDGTRNARIRIVNDDDIEPLETVNLRLTLLGGGSGSASLGTPFEATLNILSEDTADSSIGFEQTAVTVDEGSPVSLRVRRDGDLAGRVTVRCQAATSGSGVGHASPGPDFTVGTQQILTWNEGDIFPTPEGCTASTLQDTLAEGDETFLFRLQDVQAALGQDTPLNPQLDAARSTVTVTIGDGATAGRVQFTAMSFASVEANATSMAVMVARSGGNLGAASVRCQSVSGGSAIIGTDFAAVDQTLDWIDGEEGAKVCAVTLLDDGVADGQKTVNLQLSSAQGATLGEPTQAVLQISDAGAPPVTMRGSLSFTQASYSASESDGLTALVQVARIGGTDGAVSAQCFSLDGFGTATVGDDYRTVNVALNWANGDDGVKTCAVELFEDAVAGEGNETIRLELDGVDDAGEPIPLGANRLTTLNVADTTPQTPDTPPVFSFVAAQFDGSEASQQALVGIALSGARPATPVSVRLSTRNGSATAGSDYVALSQTLTWNPGDPEVQSFVIDILDDNDLDDGEQFEVQLNTPDGATLGSPSLATVTIESDDRQQAETISTSAGSVPVSVPQGVGVLVAAKAIEIEPAGFAAAVAGTDLEFLTGIDVSVDLQSCETQKTVPISITLPAEASDQLVACVKGLCLPIPSNLIRQPPGGDDRIREIMVEDGGELDAEDAECKAGIESIISKEFPKIGGGGGGGSFGLHTLLLLALVGGLGLRRRFGAWRSGT